MLLAIAVYAGWYYFSVEQLRDERVVAAVPDRLLMELAPAERVLSAPVAASFRTMEQAAEARPEHTPAEEMDLMDSEPADVGSRVASGISPGLPAIAAPGPGDASARERTARSGTASASNGIVFHAVHPTYIEVRSVETDKVLVERMLRAGESYRPPDGRGLLLSVGDAGGLEIVVDGVRIPSLGVAGAVMRDIPLDADLLLRTRVGG